MTFFLSFKFDNATITFFLSQKKYARNKIKKFGLEKSQFMRTPIATHVKVSKVSFGEKINESLCWSMIDSLLYLIASRSNTAYALLVFMLIINLLL